MNQNNINITVFNITDFKTKCIYEFEKVNFEKNNQKYVNYPLFLGVY